MVMPKGEDVNYDNEGLGPLLTLMHIERWVEHKMHLQYVRGER